MVRARILRSAKAPLLALVVVSLLSLGARSLLLGEPCMSPCTQAGDHTLIFDEAYYVNAARVIAGIRPPSGAHYNDAPLGTDPNAEHPQGAKLIMAAAITIFGDGPFAWRIGSLIMGSIAILGMFALMRAAGADRWMALLAATLMAADNLLLVMGRIGTLDIYGVAMMVWGVALYVRGRPVAAGVALAVATAFKEVSPYALLVILLLELGRLLVARRDPAAPADWNVRAAAKRVAASWFVTAGVFVGLLAIMDLIATPYADSQAKLITGGPFAEILHIINYAKGLTSPHGPQGIASYPWQWLIDLRPILYLRINPSLPGHGLYAIHPVVAFWGMISPPILALALPAMAFAAYRMARRRPREAAAVSPGEREVPIVGLAWFIGTWLPFALQSLIDQRTSYLYYMVVVMPGLYVTAIYLVSHGWRLGWRWLRGLELVWALGVLGAVIVMYPFVAVFN
ncbi:MAG TPA: phospholipid carrier-dependent glycosyltransferase [Solirubrobacteraceae bacterium]|nr:phospholipid carrier-dependent glycosyltransferase [Solirubrobacteraceae bacterium]